MSEQLPILSKDLSKQNFIGQVIYNNDPDMVGRCKVRVLGLMDDLDENLIPWFSPMTIGIFSSIDGGGNFSVPKNGAWVRVRFPNEDIYSGEYTSIQNVDPNMFTGDSGLDKEDYVGTHVLLYDADQELMIVFQPHSGITMYYRESKINIAPTNVITLCQPNNNSIITLNNDTINITSNNEINISAHAAANVSADVVNLNANSVNVGKGASAHAVNGERLISVLQTLATAISQKYPITPGMPNTSSFSGILSSSVMIKP